jgi:hypothetical protein
LPKEKPLEVNIEDAHEITEHPLGKPQTTTIVLTYRVGTEPSRVIFFPKDLDSPEYRAKVIKEDWAKASAFKPETIRV